MSIYFCFKLPLVLSKVASFPTVPFADSTGVPALRGMIEHSTVCKVKCCQLKGVGFYRTFNRAGVTTAATFVKVFLICAVSFHAFYEEPLYKGPTRKMLKYLKNLYYQRKIP